jgi:hypothetical protein
VARVRRIQCLKLLRCQCQCEGDGVFLYVRRGAGFGNRNDVTAVNGPSQRDGCVLLMPRSGSFGVHGRSSLSALLLLLPIAATADSIRSIFLDGRTRCHSDDRMNVIGRSRLAS